MENYLARFIGSQLPFDAWLAASIWLLLFIASHLTARRARLASEAQAVVVIEGRKALNRGFHFKYVVAQLVFSASLMLGAFYLGKPAFVFFSGGLIVSVAFTFGLNIQSFLSAVAMAHENAAVGQLKLSTAFSFQQSAHRLLGSAVICLLLALVLCNLALLGGAFFLGSTSAGYFRRVRQAGAKRNTLSRDVRVG